MLRCILRCKKFDNNGENAQHQGTKTLSLSYFEKGLRQGKKKMTQGSQDFSESRELRKLNFSCSTRMGSLTDVFSHVDRQHGVHKGW